MKKTADEFLEELARIIKREINTFKTCDNDWCAGHVNAYELIKEKIEQFQAEQNNLQEKN